MKPESVELIDFDGLRQHVSGFDALFVRLLQLLLEQAPLWVEELERAFSGGDPLVVRRLCHKIKGSAGTVQALHILDAVTELSAHAAGGDLSVASESRDRLVKAIHDTVAFVRASGHI